MNVLIIGGGGREHALAWKLRQSPGLTQLYAAPGNPGIGRVAECVPIQAGAVDELLRLAQERAVGLVVVGPEAPLAAGLADRFQAAGIPVFGPTKAAAELESGKAFAKAFMRRHAIPTAEYEVFDDAAAAKGYIRRRGAPIVVKADGLAAGKGVTVARSVVEAEAAVDAMMVQRAFGDAGNRVVVETCLEGPEASILALTDGERVLPLLASQDHKPAFDGDRGPNTGGMGAYAPAPLITPAILADIQRRILEPAIAGMAQEGRTYRGVLYAGLMMTPSGPQVIEFNCRFGDPEAQAVLPLLETDLLPLLQQCSAGKLDATALDWRAGACVTVVMASAGYPGSYETGKLIVGIDEAEQSPDVVVFHAGTRHDGGRLLTHGGRVLNVTAVAPNLPAAIAKAYEALRSIHFEGAFWRNDIGRRGLSV